MVTKADVTAEDLEQWLRKQLGKTEKPPNSNHVFAWADLERAGLAAAYFQGQPWCRALIVDTALKTKAPIMGVQSPYYCPSAVQFARSHTVNGTSLWLPADRADEAEPGDETYWAFSYQAQQAGLAEHVERLISPVHAGIVHDIGGNTSSGTGGSQDNGGGVFERMRPADATLLGFLRYSLVLKHQVSTQRVKRNPFLPALRAAHLPIMLGDAGDAVRGVQWAVGVPVDGAFGPLTDHGVRHFQRYHQDRSHRALKQDGEVGRLTRPAIAGITHHWH